MRKADIEADTRVFDTDQIGDIRCMARHVLRGGLLVAEKQRHARHTGHAARSRAGPNLFIGDVAAMVDQSLRVRVTEDDRLG